MARVNRRCIICNKTYYYCGGTCNGEDAHKPTWYHIFDGERCHNVYEICVAYRDKEIDAEKAYELISKLDLSDINNFAQSTKLQIEEIIRLHDEASLNIKEKNNDEVVDEEKSEVSKKLYKNKQFRKR